MFDKAIDLLKFLITEKFVSKYIVNMIVIITIVFLSLFVWAKYLRGYFIQDIPFRFPTIEDESRRRVEVDGILKFLKICDDDGLYFILLVAEHEKKNNNIESEYYKFYLANLIVKDILTTEKNSSNICQPSKEIIPFYREVSWQEGRDPQLDDIIESNDSNVVQYLLELEAQPLHVFFQTKEQLKEKFDALSGIFYNIIIAKQKYNDIESDRYAFVIAKRFNLDYFYIVGIPKSYDFAQAKCDKTILASKLKDIASIRGEY